MPYLLDWLGSDLTNVSIRNSLILVGLLISYLPQHYRIISRGTAEGISPYFVMLGTTSATSGFANILTVPKSRAAIGCCKELEAFQCAAGLLGVAQLGTQWVCFTLMYVCNLSSVFLADIFHSNSADIDNKMTAWFYSSSSFDIAMQTYRPRNWVDNLRNGKLPSVWVLLASCMDYWLLLLLASLPLPFRLILPHGQTSWVSWPRCWRQSNTSPKFGRHTI